MFGLSENSPRSYFITLKILYSSYHVRIVLIDQLIQVVKAFEMFVVVEIIDRIDYEDSIIKLFILSGLLKNSSCTWLFSRSCWTSSFKSSLRRSSSLTFSWYSSGGGKTIHTICKKLILLETKIKQIPSCFATEFVLTATIVAVWGLLDDDDDEWSSSITGSLNDTDRALAGMVVVSFRDDRAVAVDFDSTPAFFTNI